MKKLSVALCLLSVFGSVHSIKPGKQLAVRVPAVAPSVMQAMHRALNTPQGRMVTMCLGAVGAVVTAEYAVRSLQKRRESRNIAYCLDDLVAKANEFKGRRNIVADLCQLRTEKRACDPAKKQELAAYKEAEEILLGKRKTYDLLTLSSWQALQKSTGFSVQNAMRLSQFVGTLNEILQSCPNDADFNAKFGALAVFPVGDCQVVRPNSIEGCCQAFADFVKILKQDVASK